MLHTVDRMKAQIYSETKAKEVARQLTIEANRWSETRGWKYVAECQDGFGRVLVSDAEGKFVAYW